MIPGSGSARPWSPSFGRGNVTWHGCARGGELRRESVQRHVGTSPRIPLDFDVLPADRLRARERLKGLVHCLLRGNPDGEVPGWITPTRHVPALAWEEETVERAHAMPEQQLLRALVIHDVDPDTDHRHGRLQNQRCSTPSGPGAGR